MCYPYRWSPVQAFIDFVTCFNWRISGWYQFAPGMNHFCMAFIYPFWSLGAISSWVKILCRNISHFWNRFWAILTLKYRMMYNWMWFNIFWSMFWYPMMLFVYNWMKYFRMTLKNKLEYVNILLYNILENICNSTWFLGT